MFRPKHIEQCFKVCVLSSFATDKRHSKPDLDLHTRHQLTLKFPPGPSRLGISLRILIHIL